MTPLPAFPYRYADAGGAANASVLNQWDGVLWSLGRLGPAIKSGRWVTALPTSRMSLALFAVHHSPFCKVQMAPSVQPPRMAAAGPLVRNARPGPNGISHTVEVA